MRDKILLGLSLAFSLAAGTVSAQFPLYLDETKPIEQRVEDALGRMTLDEKIAVIHAQSKFSAPGVKRLGIPDMWTDDGPHGVRPDVLWDEWVQAGQTNDSCVAFPALTCLAATWNPLMARLYGESLGEEALYRDKDMILGPGVNILRTPLNGRNFEYMGEDPFLASRMVVPYVQGLQSKGVSACVKHYALNNDETYRHQVNVKVSDRALHEIYLPAFRAAVQQGGAWALMGAYNLYNGQHNCHNQILLNDILKRDWAFDGVVVSDWGGAHNMDEAVRNGLDMEFGTWTDGLTMGATNAYDNYYLALSYKKAIQDGTYTQKELDEKVRRVLRLHFRTTMNRQRPYGSLCSDAHYHAARQIAEEGIVLLKNDNRLLPINARNATRILVVGENAIKPMTVGGGSSSLKVQREISPLEGLRRVLTRESPDCMLDFARGYVGDTTSFYNNVKMNVDLTEYRQPQELIAEAVEKAQQADYVVVFGGLNKSSHQDCEGFDREEYGLPYGQNDLIEALAKVNDRLIFVNISGNPVAMPWRSRVAAIVQGWYIGSEAGNALADVLVGKANPSGKLPFTWYDALDDCAAHALKTYPGTWRTDDSKIIDEEYKEGIYVGYRWTDRQKKRPAFAFGHGLSYTTFNLSKAVADRKEMTLGDSIAFTVSVKNTGSVAGAEVVQLYVSDKKASVDRPLKELKAFRKVFLQPGESREVKLTIGRDALSFYDEATGSWKAEPGQFEALIGTASDRISSKLKFLLK
ncbi:MAG: glycoside hydrolase family 3 C-terminal domain-containing protein [Prevotella sp.]|nr:glycoside hydrolase family 3 C-terminal domain-containing protein [Prevotella sp.]